MVPTSILNALPKPTTASERSLNTPPAPLSCLQARKVARQTARSAWCYKRTLALHVHLFFPNDNLPALCITSVAGRRGVHLFSLERSWRRGLVVGVLCLWRADNTRMQTACFKHFYQLKIQPFRRCWAIAMRMGVKFAVPLFLFLLLASVCLSGITSNQDSR